MPLRTLPDARIAWLRRAIVLQPWGETQYAALVNVGDRPEKLRREFGFNTIIVLPPDAHNAITEPKHHLTEEQFTAAVRAYRRARFRVILYTGIMHCGHAPEWMSGQIGRDHPEWAQRDSRGAPIMDYGAPWLCPNTGALDYTLDYTIGIVRRYGADGVMLDNNEFFGTANGWTCYCAACQDKFRQYARDRFGAAGVEPLFGVAPSALTIPTEQGPLYALWLHWRNRVWAEALERYRERLRGVDPHLLVFANTQYAYPNAELASDLQYDHEDVVLSESRGLGSWQMSEKMLLGQALAHGRPLWNYIGTFEEVDFTRLRPQETVGPIIASSLAHGARPWIVYYGFADNQGDYRARREMSSLLKWYDDHSDLFSGRRVSPVGVIMSMRSRDIQGKAQIPGHLSDLLRRGVPVAAIRDEHLAPRELKRFRFLSLETASCLDDGAVRALAMWVRSGGHLIAAPDAGAFDALGRKQPVSALWQALGLSAAPTDEVAVGRGRVTCGDPDTFAAVIARWANSDLYTLEPTVAAEVVPYRSADRLLLHVIRHAPVAGPLVLRMPASVSTAAESALIYSPDHPEGVVVRLGAERTITLPALPVYCVIALRASPGPR